MDFNRHLARRKHAPDCFCPRCVGDNLYEPYKGDLFTPARAPPEKQFDFVPLDSRDAHILCGQVVKAISDLTYTVRQFVEETTMLPRSDSATTTAPRSQRGGQRWLKNEDLSTTPKPAKILAVKNDAENKFGPRVVLKLALDGAVIFWGVDVKKNPNYKTLEKRFGYEENNWAGQLILLGLELDEFSEQYNPAVTFPEPAKTARK